MKTFAIATLGCKVNTYESQNYLERLKQAGYAEVDFRDRADIYVINTCSVTNTAAAKSRQKIHQARRQNPSALIAVVGCYVQAADPADVASLQADVIIGAQGKDQLLERIWSTDYVGETRTVDVHIGTLRTKLGQCGEYIRTVRGVGYRMEA